MSEPMNDTPQVRPAAAPQYKTQGLSLTYPGRPAITFADMAIDAGRILGLVGPNGAGKSTLLRILAFLLPPTHGVVAYQGQEVRTQGQRFGLRRRVTLLLQHPYLLKRSVAANVAYGLRLRGESGPHVNQRVAEALGMVGLDQHDFSLRQWHQLSGGEAQRVALAARLALRPATLLLDEPTVSLDGESTIRLREAALAARSAWGTTLIIASHQHDWLASVADSVVELNGGC